MLLALARSEGMQTPNDSGAITSLEELEAHIHQSAHQTTALVMKTGARRGGRKMKAERRELMGMKLSVLSGENGRAVLPVRCVDAPSLSPLPIAVDFLTFFVASGRLHRRSHPARYYSMGKLASMCTRKALCVSLCTRLLRRGSALYAASKRIVACSLAACMRARISSPAAVESFKDYVVASKLLADRTEGTKVTYENGKFVYTNLETGESYVRSGRLSTTLVRRHERAVAGQQKLRRMAMEVAEGDERSSPASASIYSLSASRMYPNDSDDSEESSSSELQASEVYSDYSLEGAVPREETAFLTSREVQQPEIRRTMFVCDEDRKHALREYSAALRGAKYEQRDGDSPEVATLKAMLRDVERPNEESRSWRVPMPGSSAYSKLVAQRRHARFLGAHCPQVSRDFLWGDWPELEPLILNELARKGSYFEQGQKLRLAAYGEDDPLEPLVDAWVEMLTAEALSQQRPYASMEELLADVDLARAAGPGKSHTALFILKRDYSLMKSAKLMRERFHLAKSVGWGHQGREGGSKKGKVTDVDDPEFDVVGPRHFYFADQDGTVVDKEAALKEFRSTYECDPARRKLARRLKGSASDATQALRTACIAANRYNALWVTLLDGRKQSDEIADVFAIEPEYQAGFARRWGTAEGACVGTGDVPKSWDAPTLANGEPYFGTLFAESDAMDALLRHFGAQSFEEVVLSRRTIPSDLFPRFPLTDAEVAVVDFERVCPSYPTASELEQLMEFCPEQNRARVERAHALATDASAAKASEQPTERSATHVSDALPTLQVSPEALAVFTCNYVNTSLTSHCDTNCFGSGTEQCSRAHILSLGHPDSGKAKLASGKSVESIMSGKYVKEGLPRVIDESTGVGAIDWARAAQVEERGAGSNMNLYRDWRSQRRWLVSMSMGRTGDVPGNNLHFVFGVGKGKSSTRVRIVDYLTESFGGVAVQLGKHEPRAFEGLSALQREGALPPLSQAQQVWSERVALFDVLDKEHMRVLTSLFFPVLVERYKEEVTMWRAGRCDVCVHDSL